MLPDPLHPMVVHFPIVLMVLLPAIAAGAVLVIRRGTSARQAWAVPLAVTALLTVSAWAAVQTGEAQEDRVENIVGESVLHEHEEAAERFLVLSGALLLLGGIGLAGGIIGSSARALTAVGSIGLVLAGVEVGGSGGELVYVHGAASAYTSDATASAHPNGDAPRRGRDDDD